MNELKIIKHYGVRKQLKYFQAENYELIEAILKYEDYQKATGYLKGTQKEIYKQHIAEEIADVQVMLNQFKVFYGIKDEDIEEIMKYKIERQLGRIAEDITVQELANKAKEAKQQGKTEDEIYKMMKGYIRL